jgi:hypothetical protein
MTNVAKVPTIIIVHASRGYDRQAAAKYGIERTIDKCRPANILEVEDIFHSSYLQLPDYVRTPATPGAGILFDQQLMQKKAAWFESDTFIFVGGRPSKCLENTFLSALFLKLYEPSSIYKDREAVWKMRSPSGRRELFGSLLPRNENGTLNLHLNFEGIYASSIDFRNSFRSADPEEINWSPEMPWVMMDTIAKRNRTMLEGCGWNMREHINGVLGANIASAANENARVVNFYYWVDTADMVKAIYGSKESWDGFSQTNPFNNSTQHDPWEQETFLDDFPGELRNIPI